MVAKGGWVSCLGLACWTQSAGPQSNICTESFLGDITVDLWGTLEVSGGGRSKDWLLDSIFENCDRIEGTSCSANRKSELLEEWDVLLTASSVWINRWYHE